MQISRVAKERGLSEEAVRAEVAKATDKPLLGLGGEPGVNVLKVNLALDARAPKGALAQKKSNRLTHLLARSACAVRRFPDRQAAPH